MAKRKVQGFTVQLTNKVTGEAVERQWFKRLSDANHWLREAYPNWEERFNLEVFCD